MKTRCLELAALLLCLCASSAHALELTQVTSLLAQRKSGEARFVEERHVSGIEGPLRSAGMLSFTAPDRFTRTTTEPRAESMAVDGNTLTLKRGGRTRQMALDAVPEVTALIEAIRGTLTGNAALLAQHFKIDVQGSPQLWTLTMVPRDKALATQVRELRVTGMHGDMRGVELWLAGGDRSMMTIEPLQSVGAAPR